MNKTQNINIGGKAFTIDEVAYLRLKNYISALEKHYMKEDGGKEIMYDIEDRISELFTQYKDNNNREIINIYDVDNVINILGSPVDIIDDEYRSTNENSYTYKPIKKLYRDSQSRVFGGVASGISYYLSTSVVLIRLAFILLTFFYGITIVIYIILWIVIPKAVTMQQILEMRGEQVNISDIENNVKKKFYEIKDSGSRFINQSGRAIRDGGMYVAQKTPNVLLNIIAAISLFIGIILLFSAALVTTFNFDNTLIYNWGIFGYNGYNFDIIYINILIILSIFIPIILMIYLPIHHFLKLKKAWVILLVGSITWILSIVFTIISIFYVAYSMS